MKWGVARQNNKLVRIWDNVLPGWRFRWGCLSKFFVVILVVCLVALVDQMITAWSVELPIEAVKGLYYAQTLGN